MLCIKCRNVVVLCNDFIDPNLKITFSLNKNNSVLKQFLLELVLEEGGGGQSEEHNNVTSGVSLELFKCLPLFPLLKAWSSERKSPKTTYSSPLLRSPSPLLRPSRSIFLRRVQSEAISPTSKFVHTWKENLKEMPKCQDRQQAQITLNFFLNSCNMKLEW